MTKYDPPEERKRKKCKIKFDATKKIICLFVYLFVYLGTQEASKHKVALWAFFGWLVGFWSVKFLFIMHMPYLSILGSRSVSQRNEK